KNRTLQRSSKADLALIQTSQRNSDVLAGMTSSDKKGPVLSFHNLCYEVKEKRGFLFGQKTIKRKKLSNINGIMKPGLNAITGPTDGGKYLLLEILAARKDLSGLSGSVFIHEVPEDADFPHSLGYVVHDDVVMDSLTVRENLQFSASLRLPSTMTKEEKNQRIDEVIEELGLVEVADSKVRSEGLRKKMSIGMELILYPSILFLDEPTTGLDWSTANDFIRFLKRISEQRRTIIFSIHQPRYSTFQLFDSLTILASGELMYHGPAQKALGYFESAGFPCEFYSNPAELFLDFFHGVIKRESEYHEGSKNEMSSRTDDSEIKALADNFAKSTFYNDTKTELDERSRDENKRRLERKEIPCVISCYHQLFSLTWRSIQNFVGNYEEWTNETVGTLLMGLCIGVFLYVLKFVSSEIQHRVLVFFFLMAYHCRRSSSLAAYVVERQKKRFMQSQTQRSRVSEESEESEEMQTP
ncbi:broad substrate specificity ATP-binding cassette transporter ABCG2-like, partial [Sciurus carolinensis]|uniref:broad substrate specificity ATP-binding cassette transporter ABCG2-like n=1 Tax=Sciurus carolinensis TaxID=30640 RepID=UPI001FB5215D